MIERGELDFELRREIGQEGRNSRTYEAFDPQLNATIVVKQVARADFVDADEYFKEAQRLYEVRHPHVVPIHFACRTADNVCLVMPLYAGSVQGILTHRHLTVREIVKYGLGFLSGLHHVHVRGLVHLDVKPSNILLDHADRAALADFGLARIVDAHGLAEQDIMYRPHRAPESLTGTKVGAPADIYQAGLTLYRMALGGTSLEEQWAKVSGDDQAAYKAVLRGELPNRSNGAFPAHIPAKLRGAIQRALQVDPDERFGTVLDLLGELAKVDQFLDWRYDTDANGMGIWRKSSVNREHEITMERDGAGGFLVAAKTRRLDSASEKKRNQLGGKATTRSRAVRLIQSAMEELE